MRALRRVGLVLAILLVLLVALDRGGLWAAEHQAASKLASSDVLASEPDVDIEGFPFLTQVAAGRFDTVRVHSSDGSIKGPKGPVDLSGLHVTLHDLKPRDTFKHFDIERAAGHATLSYQDLNKLLGRDNTTISYGGHGRVKVKASVSFLGKTLSRAATGTVKVSHGDAVQLGNLHTSGDASDLPGVDRLMDKIIGAPQKLGDLPVGMKLRSVKPGPDGVRISMTGTNLSF